MISHGQSRCFRLLIIFALAIALVPAAAQAQNIAFAACISRDDPPPKVLGAPAALNLSVAPDGLRSIRVCADFCRNGTVPQGVPQPRGYSAFKPPYRYATLNNGSWCYCGNEIGGSGVAPGLCNEKRNCLANQRALNSKCYVNTEASHMIVDLNPPAGATAIGSGGAVAPSGGGAPAVQPPPSAGNRRPNPPTVQPGGYEPPFPLQYEGAYQMAWRNNGDPDGDVLTFGVIIWQYDWTGRRWMQMPGIRDQYGTYGMTWLKDDNYTFTTRNGLSPQTHYAWMVFACDLGKGDAALCSWSGWGLFRTQ